MALWVAALPIALPAQARPPLERSAVRLTTGLEMEWLRQPAAAGAPAGSADVLFVHGSLHGAWCWAEHWMGYLSDRGFTSHAISLRGSSGSPDGARRVRAAQHVADLGAFVEGPLAGSRPGSPPPTIVAHSFGGAYLYEYLARGHPASAAAFLCPVPPSGNMAMVGRSLRRSPRTAILVTRGLAFKSVTRSAADARHVFFDDALPEDRVQRYVAHFAADSRSSLDLADFSRNLPSRDCGADGRASWLPRAPPRLVLGGGADVVVDMDGLDEAAFFCGAEPAVVCPGLPHDLMLASQWERPAAQLVEWLRTV